MKNVAVMTAFFLASTHGLVACAQSSEKVSLSFGEFSCPLPHGFYDATGNGHTFISNEHFAVKIEARNTPGQVANLIADNDSLEIIADEEVRGARMYKIKATMEEGWSASFHMISSLGEYITIYSDNRDLVIDLLSSCYERDN